MGKSDFSGCWGCRSSDSLAAADVDCLTFLPAEDADCRSSDFSRYCVWVK